MNLDDRLSEVFDRGLRDGIDSLNAEDRRLFLVQHFIIEYEMNGLSGYLYNRLPDLARIEETVLAMQSIGSHQLADLLAEAKALFNEYSEPSPATTWGAVLSKYDPSDSLSSIASRLRKLRGYGLPESDDA